jgi:hypothetical protein
VSAVKRLQVGQLIWAEPDVVTAERRIDVVNKCAVSVAEATPSVRYQQCIDDIAQSGARRARPIIAGALLELFIISHQEGLPCGPAD